MAFFIASSPHNHTQQQTSALMRLVMYAMLPGLIAQGYFFGYGNFIQIMLAIGTALITEFIVLSLRNKNITAQLFDGSAILTAMLLGASIPSLAPWWVVVIGTFFAILVVKQLYGGLGHNPFNPAMAGYVLLLVSFPVQMTAWLPPFQLMSHHLDFANSAATIFTGFTLDGYSLEQLRSTADGFTMATPLDTLKTNLKLGLTLTEIQKNPVFGEHFALGWEWVNAGFLLGGLVLIVKKAIDWRTPLSFLASLFLCSLIAFLMSPDSSASTLFHWFSGATMLGAFFILTDPVSGATTPKARIIIGLVAGFLVYIIRKHGGYPDAVAFTVLLCNMMSPLVDQYTRPRTYGHNVEHK